MEKVICLRQPVDHHPRLHQQLNLIHLFEKMDHSWIQHTADFTKLWPIHFPTANATSSALHVESTKLDAVLPRQEGE